MAQNEVNQYDEVAANNVDLNGQTVVQTQMYPPGVPLSFRNLMAALKRTFRADLFRIRDTTTQTKLLAFDLSILSVGTRTYIWPDKNGTVALTSDVPTTSKGYLYGLTLSNNVTDIVNDIDIAAGECASNSSPPALIALVTAMTKRADAVWALGTNQGGRFHATLVDGWLYWYAIRNPTTGVSDVGCSDNATTPTGGANYPASYTQFQYIGATNRVTGALSLFLQTGNDFQFRSPIAEYNVTNPGTAAVLHSLAIPPILVKALYSVTIRDGSPVAATYAIVTSPLVNDIAPLITLHDARLDDVSPGALSIIKQVITSDRTVRVRQSNSDTGMVTTGTSFGWIDLKRQGL